MENCDKDELSLKAIINPLGVFYDNFPHGDWDVS